MLRYGVDAETFASLKNLAKNLPESNIKVLIPGLTSAESMTLTSRLLRRLAPELGVSFSHENVIDQVDFPMVEPQLKQPSHPSPEEEEATQLAENGAN